MEYSKITVPFVGKKEIKTKADNFRKTVWNNTIPIDIETIIEIKLKIRIIPVPGMMKLFGFDAQIDSSFSAIHVDEEIYYDDRLNGRFHFSLAHELGHYVLHQKFYKNLAIKDLDDFYSFHNEVDPREYSYLETQANHFANYFLIPREKLVPIREKIIRETKERHKNIIGIDEKTINSYLASHIASKFNVSSGAMNIALDDLNND